MQMSCLTHVALRFHKCLVPCKSLEHPKGAEQREVWTYWFSRRNLLVILVCMGISEYSICFFSIKRVYSKVSIHLQEVGTVTKLTGEFTVENSVNWGADPEALPRFPDGLGAPLCVPVQRAHVIT